MSGLRKNVGMSLVGREPSDYFSSLHDPIPTLGRSRRRSLNPMQADVEITSDAINADPSFNVPLRQ